MLSTDAATLASTIYLCTGAHHPQQGRPSGSTTAHASVRGAHVEVRPVLSEKSTVSVSVFTDQCLATWIRQAGHLTEIAKAAGQELRLSVPAGSASRQAPHRRSPLCVQQQLRRLGTRTASLPPEWRTANWGFVRWHGPAGTAGNRCPSLQIMLALHLPLRQRVLGTCWIVVVLAHKQAGPLVGKGISCARPRSRSSTCNWFHQISITLRGRLAGPNSAGRSRGYRPGGRGPGHGGSLSP